MKTLTDIATRLKRHLGRSSLALLETLELAVMKRYRPEVAEELEKAKDDEEARRILDRHYYALRLRHRVTGHDETLALRVLGRQLAEAPVDPGSIEAFIETFTIERSGNDLYGYSTPLELKRLMVGLSQIEQGDRIYNPCFGIGGLFGTIAQATKEVELYGEDVESFNRIVAGLTAQLSGIRSCRLETADSLYDPAWCDDGKPRRFEKVLCNPPLDLVMDVEALAAKGRFARFGVPPANASDLAFVEHAAETMSERAVVLVRQAVLMRMGLEAKIRTKMAYDGLVEAVISLPKGIVPRWNEDLALVVLSHGNDAVYFFDAGVPRYSKRKGRRNTIYRVDELVERVLSRQVCEQAKLVPLQDVMAQSLSPSHYTNTGGEKGGVALRTLAKKIYRAQRVGTKEGGGRKYMEIGVGDFVQDDYTKRSRTFRSGDAKKVERFRLEPFDILLPLRGGAGKIGIVGESDATLVPNAGVIVIRPKSKEVSCALYLYLRSEEGRTRLSELYVDTPNRTLNPEATGSLNVRIGTAQAIERFERIRRLRKKIEELERRIDMELARHRKDKKSGGDDKA